MTEQISTQPELTDAQLEEEVQQILLAGFSTRAIREAGRRVNQLNHPTMMSGN